GFPSPRRLRWSSPSLPASGCFICAVARTAPKLAQCRTTPEKFFRRNCRCAHPFPAGGNIVHDTGPGSDHGARSDGNVIGKSDPPAHHDIVPDCAASRNAGMRGEHAVPPDLDVVRDLDEVVDLGPLPDHGIADRTAVDRAIRADLDAILDDHAPDLRNLAVARRAREIAEAVLPDAGTGVDNHPVPDERMHDGRARADDAITANAHIRADDRAGC